MAWPKGGYKANGKPSIKQWFAGDSKKVDKKNEIKVDWSER
jgi:hypothetical protein